MKLGRYEAMEKALKTRWCTKAKRADPAWPYEFVFSFSENEVGKPEIHCRLKNGYTLPYDPTRDDMMAIDWQAVF